MGGKGKKGGGKFRGKGGKKGEKGLRPQRSHPVSTDMTLPFMLLFDFGRLFVGPASQALGWAKKNVDYVVNVSNVDYPVAENVHHRWVNLNFGGDLNGESWIARLTDTTVGRLKTTQGATGIVPKLALR